MFGNHSHHHHLGDPGPAAEPFDLHPGRARAMGRGWRRFDAPFGPGFDPRAAWGPGGPGFGRRGRGGRAGRGDVRLGILTLLGEAPMHGYQIIQELSERSGGVWRPSPGSIYPTLSALEDEGLVKADQQEGKRVFELTDDGRAALADAADRPAPWDEVANDADVDLVTLRDRMAQVAAATMQVAHMGSKAQLEEAHKILGEARRRLYLLLAEDPHDEHEGGSGD
jgi:DNA-binding PadR family transcriptional regulator